MTDTYHGPPIPSQLYQVAEDLATGKRRSAKVRTLLAWFGRKRRRDGSPAVRQALNELGIVTDPDYASTKGLDVTVRFKVQKGTSTGAALPGADSDDKRGDHGHSADVVSATQPALCIGLLKAANRPDELVTVTPNDTVRHATTKMMIHNYSQLPVMQGSWTIHGMISWRTIGEAVKKGSPIEFVHQCMDENVCVVAYQSDLLEAVELIAREEVVLVRGTEKTISGIVTTSDLSREYHRLAEPYLLLREIEGRLRQLIRSAFTAEEIASVGHRVGATRAVRSVSDLTFGDYKSLIEPRKGWNRLGLAVARKPFVELLESVRDARNRIMHFRGDSLESYSRWENVRKLRRLLAWLGA